MAAIHSSGNACRPSVWADFLGGAGALLCAIHCAALPIALAILPVASVGLLASGGFERGFLLFATCWGLGSLSLGYRKHRALPAFWLLIPGLLAMGAAIWLPVLHAAPATHAIGMTSGGVLVALAHWRNLRLSRGLSPR